MNVEHSSGTERPRLKSLAVFKFASCDGCQLSLLACEDELLQLAGQIEISYFLEASSRIGQGPWDVALVEGSITTEEDERRIREIRENAGCVVTIGACATAGGIQALRNWGDHEDFLNCVYARPEFISSLATSTAIADHIPVDFELRGCPVNRFQLLDVLTALIGNRRPSIPRHSVCLDCKRQGTVCVEVAQGIPCLGPVTQAGCGALCPEFDRGCYGCFGPAVQANCDSLSETLVQLGAPASTLVSLFRSFNADAPAFRQAGDALEQRESLS